jgi:hypothetical protein
VRRWTIALLSLLLTTSAAAEHGYVGVNQPWVAAVGPAVRRRATVAHDEVTTAGGTVRIGRAWGRALDVRAGLEATAGDAGSLTIAAGVAFMPFSRGRSSFGIEAEVGTFAGWRDGTGTLARIGPMFAWRPFTAPLQPICHGCTARNVHVPVQLEVTPLALDVVHTDTTRYHVGAAVRIARRF